MIKNMRSTFISDVQNLLKKIIRCKIFRFSQEKGLTVFIFRGIFYAVHAPERPPRPSQGGCNSGVTLKLSVSVEHHNWHKQETKQKGQDQTDFANLKSVMSSNYEMGWFPLTWSSNTGES